MSDETSEQDKWMAHPNIGVQVAAAAPVQDSAWEKIPPADVQAAVAKAKNRADLVERLKLPAMWSDESFNAYLRRKGVDPAQAFAPLPYDGPSVGKARDGIPFDQYQKQQAAPLRNIDAIVKDPLAAAMSFGSAGDPQAMEKQMKAAGAVSKLAGAAAGTATKASGGPLPDVREKVGGAPVSGGPNTATVPGPPTAATPPRPPPDTPPSSGGFDPSKPIDIDDMARRNPDLVPRPTDKIPARTDKTVFRNEPLPLKQRPSELDQVRVKVPDQRGGGAEAYTDRGKGDWRGR